MASADFCAFSTAFGSGYVFRRLPHRPPWVPHVSFTPSTCLIYPMRFRVAIGLYLALQTYPRMRPYMRFLFVRPELCPRVSRFPESSFLQILPRDRHPCLRLCPSRYRVDSGLTPVRNVRRQAHNEMPTISRLCTCSSWALLFISVLREFHQHSCLRQAASSGRILLLPFSLPLQP